MIKFTVAAMVTICGVLALLYPTAAAVIAITFAALVGYFIADFMIDLCHYDPAERPRYD